MKGQHRFGLLAVAAFSLIAASPVWAEPDGAPDTPLASAAEEARAQALFKDVRCVVCQHESIADSPAGIAGDMRRLVREEIAKGSTDEQVRADLVRRWGDYILFKPPVIPATWLLWFGPVGVVILVGAGLLWSSARRGRARTAPLSDVEEAELAQMLAVDQALDDANETIRRDPDASSPHDGR